MSRESIAAPMVTSAGAWPSWVVGAIAGAGCACLIRASTSMAAFSLSAACWSRSVSATNGPWDVLALAPMADCARWSGWAETIAFRSGLRGCRALNVAEDQPAHCRVHVQGLACASDDPGQPVIEAEGRQAVADAKDPDQIVNDDDGDIHGNLRADCSMRAEIQDTIEQVAKCLFLNPGEAAPWRWVCDLWADAACPLEG